MSAAAAEPARRGREELDERIREHPWFHTIDLGDGLVTNGDNPPSELIDGAIPDVAGKSVLDIGAWDGKYSFGAERAGASRVVALDHYVWKLDVGARDAYYIECEYAGLLPDPAMIDRGFLLDDVLPGKKGFDMAHEYLDSKVEAVVDDFATMDLETLGAFDVVFYFGVLYHMVDPVGALRRVRRVTEEVAVIETAAIEVPGYSEENLVMFFSGRELHADYGNWFAPTGPALAGMCRSAGFRHVELRTARTAGGRRNVAFEGATHPVHCRMVALAYP
jgi:tRNA (mo5U34)-methyltransferase